MTLVNFSNILAAPTPTGSTITFTTDVDCDPTIDYGTDTSYGSTVPESGTPTTDHNRIIPSLTPQTTYHYIIRATVDEETSDSGDQNFATPDESAAPPAEEEKYDVNQLALQSQAIFGVPGYVAAGAVSASKLEGLVTKTQMNEAITGFLGVAPPGPEGA